MMDDRKSFQQFMEQRLAAARAYVRGEAEPLDALSTRDDPATFFPPSGGYVRDASVVGERYRKDAGAFASGSETHFEILHLDARDGLGYWVGLQHAQVNLRGKPEPVPFHLRITELYRREGEWKLIHRHADALTEEQKR